MQPKTSPPQFFLLGPTICQINYLHVNLIWSPERYSRPLAQKLVEGSHLSKNWPHTPEFHAEQKPSGISFKLTHILEKETSRKKIVLSTNSSNLHVSCDTFFWMMRRGNYLKRLGKVSEAIAHRIYIRVHEGIHRIPEIRLLVRLCSQPFRQLQK